MTRRRSSARIGQSLVNAAMQWFDLNGYVYVRTQNMRVGHGRDGAIFPIKARDSQRGIPDLIAWKPQAALGRLSFPMTLFIECKVGAGKLSPDQEGWKEKIEAIG